MTDKHGLSNDDIAALAKIAECQPAGHADCGVKNDDSIQNLLSANFIEVSDEPDEPAYRLTRQGQDFLTGRGAGLNEA